MKKLGKGIIYSFVAILVLATGVVLGKVFAKDNASKELLVAREDKVNDSVEKEQELYVNAKEVLSRQNDVSTPFGEVNVAVIDSGFDPNHQDLKNQVARSYDCALKSKPNECIQVEDEGMHSKSDQKHGTHVAGIVASSRFGVARDANLYLFAAGDNGQKDTIKTKGTISAYKQILELMDSGIKIDVVNMSYGKERMSPIEKHLLKRIYDKGAILVAAAGNPCSYQNIEGKCVKQGEGADYAMNPHRDTIIFPAKLEYVISVGAVDRQKHKAIWSLKQSASGRELDIVAPGTDIMSTLPDNKYGRLSGTSMAAPFVTGVLANYKKEHPTYSNKEIVGMLYESAKSVGEPKKDKDYGYGIAWNFPYEHFYINEEIKLNGKYKIYDFADADRSSYKEMLLDGTYKAVKAKDIDNETNKCKYVYLVKGDKEIGWIQNATQY